MGWEQLIAPGLALAGTVAGSAGNKKSTKAVADAVERNRKKNLVNQSLAMGKTNTAIDQYTQPNIADAMMKAQEYRGTIAPVTQAPRLSTDVMGNATTDRTKSSISRSIVDSIRKGRDETVAMNKMNSYGDALFNNKIGTAGLSDDVGMYGNFVRGDQSVLPFDTNAGSQAGAKLDSVSDLFKAGGSIASMYPGAATVGGGATVSSTMGAAGVGGAAGYAPVVEAGTSLGGIGTATTGAMSGAMSWMPWALAAHVARGVIDKKTGKDEIGDGIFGPSLGSVKKNPKRLIAPAIGLPFLNAFKVFG